MNKIGLLIILLIFSSCASAPQRVIKLQHYDKYSNLMVDVSCTKMSEHQLLLWSRSKSISCQKNTIYVGCDYPGCRNELSPCLSGDNYIKLCNTYSCSFPEVKYLAE